MGVCVCTRPRTRTGTSFSGHWNLNPARLPISPVGLGAEGWGTRPPPHGFHTAALFALIPDAAFTSFSVVDVHLAHGSGRYFLRATSPQSRGELNPRLLAENQVCCRYTTGPLCLVAMHGRLLTVLPRTRLPTPPCGTAFAECNRSIPAYTSASNARAHGCESCR